ncbi:MAG: PAS domain S-box protein, partial [Bdellovibrionales bacterium]|nr:PAS domain S-box protein [Bdellovibrionales bacterium]
MTSLVQDCKNLETQDLVYIEKAISETSIIARTDTKGRITYVNDLFVEISGYSRDELIGKSHHIINSGVHDSEFFKKMWQDINAGKLWRGEICNRAKDGHLYWVDSIIFPSTNEAGEITSFIAIRRDVSHLKRSENQLSHDLKKSLVITRLLEVSISENTFPKRLRKLLDILTSLPWLPVKTEAGIFLVEDNQLVLKEHVNLSPQIQKFCAKVPIGHCLCGKVAETKQIVYASHIDEQHVTTFAGINPHGHYNFPILDGDELLGVVVLYLEEGHKKD